MVISPLNSDIVQKLNTISEMIVNEKKLTITQIALDILIDFTSSYLESKNQKSLHKARRRVRHLIHKALKKGKLRKRISSLIDLIFEENLPLMRGIAQEKEKEILINAKLQLIKKKEELKLAFDSNEKKAQIFQNNLKIQEKIQYNRKQLKRQSFNEPSIENSYSYFLKKVELENCPSSSFLETWLVGDLIGSYLVEGNYLARKDVLSLRLFEFLFLESPHHRPLIEVCLKSEEGVWNLNKIKQFVKRAWIIQQDLQLCELIIAKKISFSKAFFMPESQKKELLLLSSLLLKDSISIDFLEKNPKIAKFLVHHPAMCYLLQEEKVGLEILQSLSEPLLKTLCSDYDDLFVKEEFFSKSTKEITAILNRYYSLSNDQGKKKFIIQKFFNDYAAWQLKAQINYLGANSLSLHLISLIKQEKITIEEAAALTYLQVCSITHRSIYQLICLEKLTFKEALNLTWIEQKILKLTLPFLLYSKGLASLRQLSTQPIEFYSSIKEEENSYWVFYLEQGHASFEELLDVQFRQQFFDLDTKMLLNKGFELSFIKECNDFEIERLLLFSDLIKAKLIDMAAVEEIDADDLLFSEPLLKLVTHHFISLAELYDSDFWEVEKLTEFAVKELILCGHLLVEEAMLLTPEQIEVLTNCLILIQKELITVEESYLLNPEITPFLKEMPIIELIESGYLQIKALPPESVMELLCEPTIAQLVLERKILLSELNLIANEPEELLKLTNHQLVVLIKERIVTFHHALILSPFNRDRLARPFIINLIQQRLLTVENVLGLEEKEFGLFARMHIYRLIEKKIVSFRALRALLYQKKLDHFSPRLSLLVQDGYLTFKQAIHLSVEKADLLTSWEIYSLIPHDLLTVEEAFQLSVSERKKLEIGQLHQLICGQITTLEEVKHLSSEQLKLLKERHMQLLIYKKRLTLKEAFSFSPLMRDTLQEPALFTLFDNGFLSTSQLKLISLCPSIKTLKNKRIGELILNGNITVDRALTFSPQEVHYLAQTSNFNKMIYQNYSYQKILRRYSLQERREPPLKQARL